MSRANVDASALKFANTQACKPFSKRLEKIHRHDPQLFGMVLNAIDRFVEHGLGDVRFTREKVFEIRIDTRAGVRIYGTRVGSECHLLLVGDKSTQDQDLAKAMQMRKDIDSAEMMSLVGFLKQFKNHKIFHETNSSQHHHRAHAQC